MRDPRDSSGGGSMSPWLADQGRHIRARRALGFPALALVPLLVAASGCSQGSSGTTADAATGDASMPDAPTGDASSEAEPEASPDVVEETVSPEAAPDAPSDSPPDSPGPGCAVPGDACCCDGDVSSQPICGADGAVACTAGMGLYFGADCSRQCGPCMLPCPDSGLPDAGTD